MNRLSELYYLWLVGFVCSDYEIDNYSELFHYLYETEFEWVNELDSNLAVYGIDLREDFLDQSSAGRKLALRSEFCLDECSILEVFVSLAIRIEEKIMINDHFGDRTSLWFWKILEILDIDWLENDQFDADFLDGKIENNINCGRFVSKKCVKNSSIWIQLQNIVGEIAEENGEIW